jgi:hypothetical protein
MLQSGDNARHEAEHEKDVCLAAGILHPVRDQACKTANGKASNRPKDNWTIAVDEARTIIDGNHRHAAAVTNGRNLVWALVAKEHV